MSEHLQHKAAFVLGELEQQHQAAMNSDESGSYWTGHLSSSALSTALAVIALQQAGAQFSSSAYQSGLHWLIIDQHDDGSWGDTANSPGNISTTVLCWAALYTQKEQSNIFAQCYAKAAAWIELRTGGLSPSFIQRHIEKTYGNDKTFSVPIISACIIAGCFDHYADRWQSLRQLPFELAAFPQSLYAFLRLPVVS
ncbi:MAG: hypothetical protein HRU15_06940, partial [Planctomycetes bacterium]|nr:hypothetical protein [Planctomycetota bacterium]